MVMHKDYVGLNEDGTPHFHYWSDDPTKKIVMTGPIYGKVQLEDGTEYDVSEPFIEVEDGHEHHVSNAIGVRHMAEGHPHHNDEVPFVHVPTDVASLKPKKG